VSIKIQCGKCQNRYNVADNCAGKRFRCKCGEVIAVAAESAPATTPPPEKARRPQVLGEPEAISAGDDLSAQLLAAAEEEDRIPVKKPPR
jgi:hypothetical protein